MFYCVMFEVEVIISLLFDDSWLRLVRVVINRVIGSNRVVKCGKVSNVILKKVKVVLEQLEIRFVFDRFCVSRDRFVKVLIEVRKGQRSCLKKYC